MNVFHIRHVLQTQKRTLKRFLSKLTLGFQLVLFMTLFTSLITFILIYKEYTATRNTTIQNLTDTTGKLLELEAENLDSYLSDLAHFCILPCYDFKLTKILEQKMPFPKNS
ncbi:MAG: hypothetical protein GX234_00080 [Clostridiales bacterium]|nr:hypothetical protein [Clostridiales bacterium]